MAPGGPDSGIGVYLGRRARYQKEGQRLNQRHGSCSLDHKGRAEDMEELSRTEFGGAR